MMRQKNCSRIGIGRSESLGRGCSSGHGHLSALCLAVFVAVGICGSRLPAWADGTGQERILHCTAVPPDEAGYADYFVHEHHEDCYDGEGWLVCPLPQIEAHEHSEDCYSDDGKELTCGKQERILHTHTDECYAVDEDGKRILTCGRLQLTEHVHGDECFIVPGADQDSGNRPEDPESMSETPIVVTTEGTETAVMNGSAGHDGVDAIDGEETSGEPQFVFLFPENEEEDSVFIFLFPEEDADETGTGDAEEPAEPEELAPDAGEPNEDETDNSEGNADEMNPAETPDEAEMSDETEKPDEDAESDQSSESDGNDASNEDEDTEHPMPAQSFTAATEEVEVTVEAPEGAFPAGTVMVVKAVEVDDDTISSVTEQIEGRVKAVQAVDISFFDAEGNPIEPLVPVQVRMKSALIRESEAEKLALIHMPDDVESDESTEEAAAPEVIDARFVDGEGESETAGELHFESDAF